MYLLDFFKNLFKKSNIGIIIWLVLNTLLLVFLFSNGFENVQGIFIGILAYLASIVIALSPAGEFILRLQNGCKKITDQSIIDRIQPLFNDVYAKAKKENPELSDNIKLYMNRDSSPNAFATGRKTVCFTKGLLNMSDDEIKAIFAHEFGHLAHKDTDVILVVAVGNMIVSAIFVIYRVIFSAIGIAASMINDGIGGVVTTFFIDLCLVFFMWLWTKLGVLLCLHSSRKNEFGADAYAARLGYGKLLAQALTNLSGGSVQSKGLFASLSASHPSTPDRIAALEKSETAAPAIKVNTLAE
jgi:heat shock protein HtpX